MSADTARKVKFDWGGKTPTPGEVNSVIQKMGEGYDLKPVIALSVSVKDMPQEMLDAIIELADTYEAPVKVAVEAKYTSNQQLSFWDQESLQWRLP